ncbi:MAG: amino acid ABC transporter permease, partial [Treponema sp.]|nr:amino acid ABC transporter permease [Treponema sp.]
MSPQIFADIFTPVNLRYIFMGLRTTILVSLSTVLLSVLLGTFLALCRNYEKQLLGRIASIYIEVFRS